MQTMNMMMQAANKLVEEEIFRTRTIRTLVKKKDGWMDNAKENSSFIQNTITDLWKDNGNEKGIACAAGPSLSEDLFDLRLERKNAELICVDAALKFLLNNDIEPDYCFSSDDNFEIMKMLDVGRVKTKLIANVIIHPLVNDVWKGDGIFWFIMANNAYDLDNKAMIQDMHAIATRVGANIIPGGNVSSLMNGFMLSVRNINKLILYGHDFCWKTDMYCGGNHKNLEKIRIETERNAGTLFETINTKGETVLTNNSLKSFCAWHKQNLSRMRNRIENRTTSTILEI